MLNLYKASMLCADFPNFRWKLFQVSDDLVIQTKAAGVDLLGTCAFLSIEYSENLAEIIYEA